MQIMPISAFKAMAFSGRKSEGVIRYDEGQPYMAYSQEAKEDQQDTFVKSEEANKQAEAKNVPASHLSAGPYEASQLGLPGYRHEDYLY